MGKRRGRGGERKPRGCRGEAGGSAKPAVEALDKDLGRSVLPSNAAA